MSKEKTFTPLSSTEILINGTVYVRKDSIRQDAKLLDNMPYVIVRTYSAGVFAGYLEHREGKEGIIRYSRRIWQWFGAASLSQLAVDGTKEPNKCKFPCVVDKTEVTGIIEVLSCTEIARENIQGVPIWEV